MSHGEFLLIERKSLLPLENLLSYDVRIWNVVRTAQQIQDTIDSELTGNESGLVLYYKLEKEEDEDPAIVKDSSPEGHNGT
jgi:hypothetical protein